VPILKEAKAWSVLLPNWHQHPILFPIPNILPRSCPKRWPPVRGLLRVPTGGYSGPEVLVLYQKRPPQILMRLLISPLRSPLIQH
jgi:hypothetical protein